MGFTVKHHLGGLHGPELFEVRLERSVSCLVVQPTHEDLDAARCGREQEEGGVAWKRVWFMRLYNTQ